MIRRNNSEEAGARTDGLVIVSVIFIAAFTLIAWTTDPVYTGIDVGDRVPELKGKMTTEEQYFVCDEKCEDKHYPRECGLEGKVKKSKNFK